VRGEEDAEHGAHGDPRPDAVLGGLLVLVHGHLAFGVLGDDGGVVGTDLAGRVQRLDGFVVGVRVCFAVVGGHVEKHWCVCHACSLAPGSVVSAVNARAGGGGNRRPVATTPRQRRDNDADGLAPSAAAPRQSRIQT